MKCEPNLASTAVVVSRKPHQTRTNPQRDIIPSPSGTTQAINAYSFLRASMRLNIAMIT